MCCIKIKNTSIIIAFQHSSLFLLQVKVHNSFIDTHPTDCSSANLTKLVLFLSVPCHKESLPMPQITSAHPAVLLYFIVFS